MRKVLKAQRRGLPKLPKSNLPISPTEFSQKKVWDPDKITQDIRKRHIKDVKACIIKLRKIWDERGFQSCRCSTEILAACLCLEDAYKLINPVFE
jgi:hypothetical protein